MKPGRTFGHRFSTRRPSASNRFRRAIQAVAEPLERRMFLDGQVNFAAHVDYATREYTRAVTTADLNGDGKLDLAAVNWTNSVSVLLGNGDGTFAGKADYPTDSNPCSIVAADFNADSKIDLATANSYNGSVSILLNNGGGTFATNANYPAGTGTGFLTAADLNGDGAIDIVATNSNSNTICVFLNNGDGTFAAKADYPTGTSPNSVAAGDFNGDGKLDMAVSNHVSKAINVFFNNGDGTFAPKVDYAVGSYANSITAADLNGDGNTDLAIAYGSSYSLRFNPGDGTFANETTCAGGSGSTAAMAVDINADGNVDLVSVGSGMATLVLNQGNGTFSAGFQYATGGPPSLSVAAGDFNGDGRVDLAVAEGDSGGIPGIVGVLLNIGDTDLAPTDISLSGNAVSEMQPVGTTVGNFTTTQPDAAIPFTYALVSGPGADDNAAFMISGTTLKTASVFLSQNKSSYSIRVRSTDPGGLYVERVFTVLVVKTAAFAVGADYQTGFAPYAVTTADFNGDGKLDMAVANADSNSVTVLLNTGNGAFQAGTNYSTGKGAFAVAAGDLSGDGKPDLAVANGTDTTVSVLLNNGNGTFAPKVDYATGAWPQSITMADFNGDGKNDLAVANFRGASVSVLLNNGDGTFAAAVDYGAGPEAAGITAADFNRDGAIDLAVANYSTRISVLLNRGDGTFAAKIDYSGAEDGYATGSPFESVTAADLNGDGWIDLAAGLPNTVSVLLNRGDGTFSPYVDYLAGINVVQSVAAADVNGDGTVDLIAVSDNYGSSSGLAVLLNTGDGTFATAITRDISADPRTVAIADFNDDGRPDLAVANRSRTQVLWNADFAGGVPCNTYVPSLRTVVAADFNGDGSPDLAMGPSFQNPMALLINKGDGIFSAQRLPSAYTSAMTVADFNGDGNVDLAWTDGSDSVSITMGKGDSTFLSPVRYVVGSGALSLAAADLNQDGKPDLVVNRGTSSVLLNKGDGTFLPKVDYAVSANLPSIAVADFNGDGKPDLAFANTSGLVSVLLNQGDGTFADKKYYPAGNVPKAVAAADFDGDGRIDLAVANNNSVGAVSILLNQGGGVFSRGVDLVVGQQLTDVFTADFDGDGRIDIAAVNYYAAISVFLNRGAGLFAPRIDYALTGQAIAAADFNGDGRIDLASINGGTSANIVSVFLNCAPKPLAVNAPGDAYIKRVGDYIEIWHNADGAGTPTIVQGIGFTPSLSINGTQADDTLVLDLSGGSFIPAGGMSIDGGEGTDRLLILGTTASDSIRLAGGQLFINGSAINLAGVEQIILDANTPGAAVELASLTLEGASSLSLASGKALCLSGLSLGPDATLDLSDGALILQSDPASRDQLLASISQAIASRSLRTSQADDLHGLAAILNSDAEGKRLFNTFAGISVDESSILLKLTWNGDADLNGILDGSDYFFIDKGYLSRNSANPPTGYHNGDFDYNGTIDGSDYFLIDKAFLAQNTHVPSAPLAAAAAPQTSVFSAKPISHTRSAEKTRRRHLPAGRARAGTSLGMLAARRRTSQAQAQNAISSRTAVRGGFSSHPEALRWSSTSPSSLPATSNARAVIACDRAAAPMADRISSGANVPCGGSKVSRSTPSTATTERP